MSEGKDKASVAIIGGGIAGMSSASQLARDGYRVEVFEQHALLGHETTWAPGTLQMWDEVVQARGQMNSVRRGGIALQGFCGTVGGLVKRAVTSSCICRCKKTKGESSLTKAQQYKHECFSIYEKFKKEFDPDKTFLFDDGCLHICNKSDYLKNVENFKHASRRIICMTKPVPERKMVFEAATQPGGIHPNLRTPLLDGIDYYGVIFCRQDGQCNSHELMKAHMRIILSYPGNCIHANTPVTNISEKDDKVYITLANNNMLAKDFDFIVIAVGSFPKQFLKRVMPEVKDQVKEIFGVKGYSMTARMPEDMLNIALADRTDNKYIQTFRDANHNLVIRIAGGTDPVDLSDPHQILPERLKHFFTNPIGKKIMAYNDIEKWEDFLNGAPCGPHPIAIDWRADVPVINHYRNVQGEVIQRGRMSIWTGVRPCCTTSVPLVRNVKNTNRCVILSGFNTDGFVFCWKAAVDVSQHISMLATDLEKPQETLANKRGVKIVPLDAFEPDPEDD